MKNNVKPGKNPDKKENETGLNYANEVHKYAAATSPDGSSSSTFQEPVTANHNSTQDGVFVKVETLNSENIGRITEEYFVERGNDEKNVIHLPSQPGRGEVSGSTGRDTPEGNEKDFTSIDLNRRRIFCDGEVENFTSRSSSSSSSSPSSSSSSSSPTTSSSEEKSEQIGERIERRISESSLLISSSSSSVDLYPPTGSITDVAKSISIANHQPTNHQLILNSSLPLSWSLSSSSFSSISSSSSPFPSISSSSSKSFSRLSSEVLTSPSDASSSPTSLVLSSLQPSSQLLAQPIVGVSSQLLSNIPGFPQGVELIPVVRQGEIVLILLAGGNNSKQLTSWQGLPYLEDQGQVGGAFVVDQSSIGHLESPHDPSLQSLDLSIRRQHPRPLTSEVTVTSHELNVPVHNDSISIPVSDADADKLRIDDCIVENLSSRDSENEKNPGHGVIMLKSPMASNNYHFISVSAANPAYFSQPILTNLQSPSIPSSPSTSSVMSAYALLAPPTKQGHQGHFVLTTAPSLPQSFSSPPGYTTPLQSPTPGVHAPSLASTSKQFTCNICGKMYNSEKYLSMHLSIHNPSPSGPQQKFPVFVDKKDEKMQDEINPIRTVFETLKTSINHELNIKIPERQISSAVDSNSKLTDLNDSQKNLLKGKQNVKVMASGGQWKCKLCDKFFAQNSNYKNHMRTHSNERPYVCEICSIGFKERYHLKKHLLFKHSDEAKEQCRVCGKRFKDSTAVRAHERTHSNDRPYSCPRCQKSFKTSECLWHHENRSKTCGKTAAVNATKVELQNSENQIVNTSACKPARRKKLDVHPSNIIEEIPSIPLSSGTEDYMEHFGHSQIHQFTIHAGDNNMARELNQNHHQLYYIQQYPNVYRQISDTQVANMNFIQADQKVFQPVQQKHLLNLHEFIETKVQMSSQTINYLNGNNKSPQLIYAQSPGTNLTNLPTWNVTPSFSKSGEDFSQRSDTQDQSHFIFDRQDSSNSLGGIKFEDPFQLSESYLGNIDGSLNTPTGSSSGEKLFIMDGSSSQNFSDEEGVSSKTIFNHDDVAQEEVCLDEAGKENGTKTSDTNESNVEDKSELLMFDDKYGFQKNEPPLRKNCYSTVSYQQIVNKSELIQNASNIVESERPFRCEICQTGFKLKVHLKKHQLYKHSDDYPCECKFCGKRFKDSSAVRLHERTHSEERPFSCECGKSFKTRENLWGHKHRGPCDFNNANKEGKVACPILNSGNKAYSINDAANSVNPNQTTFVDRKSETSLNFVIQTNLDKDVNKLQHFESFNRVEQQKQNEEKVIKLPLATTSYIDRSSSSSQQQILMEHVKSPPINMNLRKQTASAALGKYSAPQMTSTNLTSSGDSRITSKSSTSSTAMATNLPTAVVVPIKRKKTEIGSEDIQPYIDPSSSSNILASLPLRNQVPGTVHMVTQQRQHLHMAPPTLQFDSGMRIINSHNISYPAALLSSDRSSIGQLSNNVNKHPKGGVVLSNNGLLLVGSKPSLPPFESLLYQAEQSRQHLSKNSMAYNGQNVCGTKDNGSVTANSQLVYPNNTRVI